MEKRPGLAHFKNSGWGYAHCRGGHFESIDCGFSINANLLQH